VVRCMRLGGLVHSDATREDANFILLILLAFYIIFIYGSAK